MNAFKTLGGAALALVLVSGLAAPAMAQKLDNQKNGAPPVETTAATTTGDIDFGDDSGAWTNDGECDDPRFFGAASSEETVEADIGKDATDCQAAFNAGTVTLNPDGPTATAAVSTAQIDFGDDSSSWSNDGQCDDPRFEGTGSADETIDEDILKDATDCQAAFNAGTVTVKTGSTTDVPVVADVASAAVDFGDDSSEFANDGECDDPRFEGTGAVPSPYEDDVLKDATDCKTAFDAGTVTLKTAGATNDPVVANVAVDFGDDSNEWANDGECDDPRFEGIGAAGGSLESSILTDATDCRTAFEAGRVTLKTDGPTDTPAVAAADINFGDNSSEYANDEECDDPRFSGTGSAAEPVQADILRDADDCRAAIEAGTVTFVGAGPAPADIDYGDDTSAYANDGECDDPRFTGPGTAGELVEADLGHDATDCRTALEAGSVAYGGETPVAMTVPEFDYGSDFSAYANDGECDDLRFMGEGTDKKLLFDDLYGDATDCRTLEADGRVMIRTVYSPAYAAAAPHDSSHVDFGDNTSEYADDGECDDLRFEGPGVATSPSETHLMHDAADCKATYEAGTSILITEAMEGM